MRVVTFNPKGGQGKTPTALAIAKEIPAFIISNDSNADFEGILKAGTFLKVGAEQAIPMFDDNNDVVYDLRGAFDNQAVELLDQADLVVIPHIAGDDADRKKLIELANTCVDVLPDTQLAILVIKASGDLTVKAVKAQVQEIIDQVPDKIHTLLMPKCSVMAEIKTTGLGISDRIEQLQDSGYVGAATRLKGRSLKVIEQLIALARK